MVSSTAKGTSLFTNSVIWFGVAVSVSEIEVGIEMAGGGIATNILPLILGHLLGGVLLFIVGLMGARTRLNAMGTTRASFGKYGAKFFAALNLAQLIGWIAVLNSQGAAALQGLNFPLSMPLTCVLLAVLIGVWLFVGFKNTAHIATVAMSLMVLLLAVLTVKLLGMDLSAAKTTGLATAEPIAQLPFWVAFEISLAMPLSWLPVISDYTKNVEKPVAATATSSVVYTMASLWMYLIGMLMGGLGFTIPSGILAAGFGAVGIFILLFSTVTTNFLAANSAGESSTAIYSKFKPKIVGLAVCALSTVLAIWGIMDMYIHFLYLIASVFAPMAVVLAVSYYLVPKHLNKKGFWIWNFVAWLIGFIVYQFAGESPVGPSITSMATSALLTLAAKFKK